MSRNPLFSILVPDAPPYRRTDRDAHPGLRAEARARAPMGKARKTPGLQEPALVSSCTGSIDRILFAFPTGMARAPYAAAYQSVIGALRKGTRFVVVHHPSAQRVIAGWFAAAGHAATDITYVPLPEYVSFTDWAEDAYVALTDAADGTTYLMEPWEFPRAGDALIADAVEEHADISASQAPLVFQGGNCLVGPGFWLLGKDYFADSVDLLDTPRPPVAVGRGETPAAVVTRLFGDYVDARRKLVVLGTRKPIPLRNYYGIKDDQGTFILDVAAEGAGTFQPIFHIDMFVTLLGRNAAGKPEALVGSPRLGDKSLGTTSPYALDDVYDTLAADLVAEGLAVHRNPIVHRPTMGETFTLGELQQMATDQGDAGLTAATKDLAGAGAAKDTPVKVRSWHHVTWNNCLVEDSAAHGRHVYLPTFGHGSNRDLAAIDQEMAKLFTTLGFTVHALGDFNPFAQRQGVVHCIKKYLARGDGATPRRRPPARRPRSRKR